MVQSCSLENFINSKPSGLKSILGFRGQSISGGQKQRIAIARAILKKKQILILDESTSSLDRKMEKELLVNIHKILKNNTIIHVTHNPEILDLISKIYKNLVLNSHLILNFTNNLLQSLKFQIYQYLTNYLYKKVVNNQFIF